jgi:hypothetical protein
MDEEERLRKSILNVKECQKSKSYTSCMICPSILECDIRTEYVRGVYKSMNPNIFDDSDNAGFSF